MRKRNQKGFLIALCLCMLSLSGIYGVYQYQKSAAPTPEEQSAQLEQDQKETANSRGAAGQTEAKIETEEDVEQIRQNWQRQSRKIRRSRLHRLKMVRQRKSSPLMNWPMEGNWQRRKNPWLSVLIW